MRIDNPWPSSPLRRLNTVILNKCTEWWTSSERAHWSIALSGYYLLSKDLVHFYSCNMKPLDMYQTQRAEHITTLSGYYLSVRDVVHSHSYIRLALRTRADIKPSPCQYHPH